MASSEHCAYCFDVLIHSFDSKSPLQELKKGADQKFPLFVTWKKHSGDPKNYKLRGCIGTFSPLELASGLREYALTSAFKDSRFSPMKTSELPYLMCDVSLLTNFETAKHIDDWTVGKHGITIEFVCPVKSKSYSATYLPEVAEEQGWNRSRTITELIQKAGYTRTITSRVKESIRLTRYESSKASLSYDAYVKMRQVKNISSPLQLTHKQHKENKDDAN
jgi:uncharacterized protein (TIGR00296 family)